jgi:LacI family transcriptional regulator
MTDSHSNPQKTRILTCMNWENHTMMDPLHLGIRQFALSRPNWKIGLFYDRDRRGAWMEDILKWEPKGLLIATKTSDFGKLTRALQLPTVVIDLFHEHPPGVSRLEIDEVATGRQAASYLMEKRFRHFAVVTIPSSPPRARMRMQGFQEALRQEGVSAPSFELDQVMERPWVHNPELEQWLRDLPKPVGIYCVKDAAAQRVLEHCEWLKIRVPTEVSILGTNNHEMACISMSPTLSSLSLPLERMGYRAAEVLDEALESSASGDSPPIVHERIQPGDVVERQSTSLRAIPDPAVSKAVDFLHEHALNGATIPEAVRHAGVGRRTLELGFKKYLGVTPGQYIGELKINYAKKLLVETDLRMWEIAEGCRMSPEYFNTLFRRVTGTTPNAFRKEKSSRMMS